MPPQSESTKFEPARRGRKRASKKYDPVVEETVDFILVSISDPHNIRHCGRCLLGALLCVAPFVKTGDIRYTIPKIARHDAFWQQIYNLVVVKRSPEEFERLMTRFSQCHCNLKDKNIERYHETGLGLEPTVMDRTYMVQFAEEWKKPLLTAERCALAVDLFYLLHIYFTQWCGIKSVGKGNAQKWPYTATDLVPYGPDDTIGSLLQWYSYVPDPSIFSVIGSVTQLSQFLVVPSIIRFQVSKILVESTRMVVDATMAGLRRLDAMKKNGETNPKSSFSVMMRFAFQARSFLEYINGFKPLPIDVRSPLLRGSETKLMQLCSIMLYLCFDLRYHKGILREFVQHYHYFAYYGQWLFRFYHMHLYPRPDMPVHPEIVALDKLTFPPPASRRSTEEAAIFYIANFHKDQRCSALLCPNSMHSAGRAFQRCARCNVVSYCGRECQTKAWREEQYPHKRVCPILRTLVAVGGGPAMFFPVANEVPILPGASDAEVDSIKNYDDLRPYILRNWKNANVSEEDIQYVFLWGKLHDASRDMPDGTEWTPGFDDYDALIAELSEPLGSGPQALYIDRLARWPSEVAKEKEHLEVQAFWNEEIEC